MTKATKKKLYIGAGWLVFMTLFFILGGKVTVTRLDAFIGITLLTGVYAGIVWVIGKIQTK